MNKLTNIAKRITMVGQFGLSLLMPTLLCILLCWYITTKTNIGSWIYILGFIMGLGASFMTAYKFYLLEVGKTKKEDRKRASFNSHL